MCNHHWIVDEGNRICCLCGLVGEPVFVHCMDSYNYTAPVKEYSRLARTIKYSKKYTTLTIEQRRNFTYQFLDWEADWLRWEGKTRKYFFSTRLIIFEICKSLKLKCSIPPGKIMRDKRKFKKQLREWEDFLVYCALRSAPLASM